MLVLQEMGITETIGLTEHVEKDFYANFACLHWWHFSTISNYLALEYVHYLVFITDTSCGGEINILKPSGFFTYHQA